jgi:hypothetical protein
MLAANFDTGSESGWRLVKYQVTEIIDTNHPDIQTAKTGIIIFIIKVHC